MLFFFDSISGENVRCEEAAYLMARLGIDGNVTTNITSIDGKVEYGCKISRENWRTTTPRVTPMPMQHIESGCASGPSCNLLARMSTREAQSSEIASLCAFPI